MDDIGVRPGLFSSGREALRICGLWILLASPFWGGVLLAIAFFRIGRAG